MVLHGLHVDVKLVIQKLCPFFCVLQTLLCSNEMLASNPNPWPNHVCTAGMLFNEVSLPGKPHEFYQRYAVGCSLDYTYV